MYFLARAHLQKQVCVTYLVCLQIIEKKMVDVPNLASRVFTQFGSQKFAAMYYFDSTAGIPKTDADKNRKKC